MAFDPDAQATEPTPAGSGYFWILVVAVLLGSFLVRMRGSEQLYRDAEVLAFSDLDSQRRLARLEALAQSETYPVVEVRDGFPQGSISHWTQPFDWFLQALNPFVSAFAGPAQGYEPAAVYAGPVLCVLCVAFFLWGAVRMLGRGPGLLAAVLYSLQYPVVLMFMVGNGDHQNLQHLCLLVFALLWLLRSADRVGGWAAPVSGLGLGLGLWISTESMLLLLSWIAVTGVLAVLRQQDERHLRDEQQRCVALLVTLALGMFCEQTDALALQWDLISWFQVYPVAVFCLFVFAMRRWTAWIAATVALGLGLCGLFGIPGFESALSAQLEDFAVANVWLQEAVSEFRPSFAEGSEFSLMAGIRRFTWLLLALPVFLVAVAFARALPLRSRVVLIAATVATFAMAVHEVKLSHLFAVWYPLAVMVGGMVIRDRWIQPSRVPLGLAFSAVMLGLLLGLTWYRAPSGDLHPQIKISDDAVRDLCRWLKKRDGKPEGSVMAPWELGAQIMYRAEWPVVASGYHRNIAGIHDAYRYFLSQPNDAAVIKQILDTRKVRYVVAWFDRSFVSYGQVVLGGERVYRDGKGKFTDLFSKSLFYSLRYSEAVPGYRLAYESPVKIQLAGSGPQPIFRVFEVVR
jgi:hypothetical protein